MSAARSTRLHPRVQRERRTVETMIRLYCRGRHGGRELCPSCRQLLSYADARAAKCPFQEGKTTCAKCPVHCYRAEMREEIRAVMRYAGPRMLWRHPVLAVLHLFQGLRRTPERPRPKDKTRDS